MNFILYQQNVDTLANTQLLLNKVEYNLVAVSAVFVLMLL